MARRKEGSTALQYMLAEWKSRLDSNEYIIAVFLDLRRAFETICREALIKKLEKYGITGVALEWFKSYLFDRYQATKIFNNISSKLLTEWGVPQGSCLEPLHH